MTDFMSFACRCENLMHYYKGSLSLLIHLFWPLVLHNKAVKVSITSEWFKDSDFAALHFNLHELVCLCAIRLSHVASSSGRQQEPCLVVIIHASINIKYTHAHLKHMV